MGFGESATALDSSPPLGGEEPLTAFGFAFQTSRRQSFIACQNPHRSSAAHTKRSQETLNATVHRLAR